MLTMQDIANHLGLSRSTVSHVLNGRGDKAHISKETQRRIRAAAQELGFQRNEVASSMATGRSKIVCMLVQHLGCEFHSQCAEGALREANDAELFLKLATWDDPDNFRVVLRRLAGLLPRGFLCRGLRRQELRILKEELELNPRPTVLLDPNPGCGDWAATVASDDLQGYRLVVAHLLGLGHRNLGFLSEPLDHASHYHRFELFKQAATEAGLLPGKHFTVDYPDMDAFAANHAATHTAVVCASDGVAYAFMKALERRGVMSPRDLSITGYGDTSAVRFGTPHLTTVREDYYGLGRLGFKTLLEMANGTHPGDFDRLLPVELMPGETSNAIGTMEAYNG